MDILDPNERININEVIAELPAYPERINIHALRSRISSSDLKIFVLDDDPTGTQTVHDVPVLTSWRRQYLERALSTSTILTYVSTNTRSMDAEQAGLVQLEFLKSLREVNEKYGKDIRIVSRSDSTLRGHFSIETSTLCEGLSTLFSVKIDGILVIPFFEEGNRVTINDVHYIREGEVLIPVAITEFAQDTLFGYSHSNLKKWIEEKTEKRVSANTVHSISLSVIRKGGVDAVRDQLLNVSDKAYVVVNAVTYEDLSIFVAGLIEAENAGKRFLYRTAASFVKIRGGLVDKELLSRDQILGNSASKKLGLIIVGSYVNKTTKQLKKLRDANWGKHIELPVQNFISNELQTETINRMTSQAIRFMNNGNNVIISTSRHHVKVERREGQRQLEERISDALVKITKQIIKEVTPNFIVAKGGITSHVLACDALSVKSALVLGQVAAGVPVWRLGYDSALPNIPFIVFPGNVGDGNLLYEVVCKLS